MNLPNRESAIKRFTYDWLIRFFELHPIGSKWLSQRPSKLLYDTDRYSYTESKYHPVSPLFKRLSELYVPHVYGWFTGVETKIKKSFELIPKKVIILRKSGDLLTIKDAIKFLKYGVYFDIDLFAIKDHHFEYAEFLCLLSHLNCDWLDIRKVTTERKVYLTEVCQHFKNLTNLVLDSKDIVVENNFPEVFAANNVSLHRARFYNLSVSEEAVIKFLKKSIIKKKKSYYQGFIFHFRSEGLKRISMSRLAVALHNTCRNAGFYPNEWDCASKAKDSCDVVEVNLTSKVTEFEKLEYTFNVLPLTYGII